MSRISAGAPYRTKLLSHERRRLQREKTHGYDVREKERYIEVYLSREMLEHTRKYMFKILKGEKSLSEATRSIKNEQQGRFYSLTHTYHGHLGETAFGKLFEGVFSPHFRDGVWPYDFLTHGQNVTTIDVKSKIRNYHPLLHYDATVEFANYDWSDELGYPNYYCFFSLHCPKNVQDEFEEFCANLNFRLSDRVIGELKYYCVGYQTKKYVKQNGVFRKKGERLGNKYEDKNGEERELIADMDCYVLPIEELKRPFFMDEISVGGFKRKFDSYY